MDPWKKEARPACPGGHLTCHTRHEYSRHVYTCVMSFVTVDVNYHYIESVTSTTQLNTPSRRHNDTAYELCIQIDMTRGHISYASSVNVE